MTTSNLKFSKSTAFFSTFLVLSYCSKLQALSPNINDSSHNYGGLRLLSSSNLYPRIFEPIREDGVDILYVFVCGAYIEPERYVSFLETLHATASHLRLWIAIVRDSVNLTPESLESALDEALIKVGELDFRTSTGLVFLGGHSLGGTRSVFVAYKRAVGLTHLGSSFFVAKDLLEYPIPVLTVIGQRDGIAGYHSAAFDSFKVADVEREFTQEHTYYYKPVVVIPGMNHAQGYDGENLNFTSGELVAEIPLEQAHAQTAAAVAAFLTVTSQGIASKNADNARARNILKAKVDVGREAVLTFGEALEKQGNGVEEMQARIAAGSSLTVDKVTVLRQSQINNFNFSRPYEIGGRVIIPVYLNELVGSQGFLKNMWVKFRSREAILNDFGNTGLSKNRSAHTISTAREFNERTFHRAMELVTDVYRQNYIRDGVQIRFVDDLVLENIDNWDASDVIIVPSKDDARVYDCQSPVYKSGDAFYMKLITTGRAMTWIYEDAFRFFQRY